MRLPWNKFAGGIGLSNELVGWRRSFLGSDRPGAGGFAGAFGPRPRQRDPALRARDAGGARWDGAVGCAVGASGHDAFSRPQGDADADADRTRNGTVGQSDGRVSSPPDGLGGWPLKSHQPGRQASARSAPRQRCAGAGLRPLLSRRRARERGCAVNDGLRRAWRSTV